MKVLVTRVHSARVVVEGKTVSSIERGLVLFVGMGKGDSENDVVSLAEKVANLRVFENDLGKLHYSVMEKKYQVLCVSNFTLCANTEKGRRPSFDDSMEKEAANKYFENFVLVLQSKGIAVAIGVFGEHMDISLDLDGPVNITLES
jgi:D-aminoacyl-tRNA deacylase